MQQIESVLGWWGVVFIDYHWMHIQKLVCFKLKIFLKCRNRLNHNACL